RYPLMQLMKPEVQIPNDHQSIKILSNFRDTWYSSVDAINAGFDISRPDTSNYAFLGANFTLTVSPSIPPGEYSCFFEIKGIPGTVWEGYSYTLGVSFYKNSD